MVFENRLTRPSRPSGLPRSTQGCAGCCAVGGAAQTEHLPGLLALCGHRRSCSQAEMFFFSTDRDPLPGLLALCGPKRNGSQAEKVRLLLFVKNTDIDPFPCVDPH